VPEVHGLRQGGSVRDFRLASWQRRRLRAALRSARDVRVVKRIVALLELDRGTSQGDVAAHLGVTRQTLYNWTQHFDAGGGLPALHDRPRRGRPPKLCATRRRVLAWLLKQPPDSFGYQATGWTAALLRLVLATRLGVQVSVRTVRRALNEMRHAWKRPRYALLPDPDREKKTLDSPTDRAVA
jgi:transposase